jgi:hypothetical protein
VIALAQILGYFILIPACLAHAWTWPTYPSIKPTLTDQHGTFRRLTVDTWKWQWLNHWYANSEDGVSGRRAYIHRADGLYVNYYWQFPAWMQESYLGQAAIAWAWSAWRNGANNLKRPLRTDGNNTPWRPT